MAGYSWDAQLLRYRYPSGNLVPRSTVRRTLEQSLANLTRRTDGLADDLRAGRISLNAWRSEMREIVKQTQMASHELARGGRVQMTQADYGRVGQATRAQYAYLDNWAAQLQAGTPISNGRAKQYLMAGRAVYLKEDARQAQAAGYDQVRSILHEAEHCAECIAEAALGFIPMAQHIPVGSRQCLTNDRCTVEYRNSGTGQVLGDRIVASRQEAGLPPLPPVGPFAPATPRGLPAGVPVSSALRVGEGGASAGASRGIAIIDAVHGDGDLPSIPVVTNRLLGGHEAQFRLTDDGAPQDIKVNASGQISDPERAFATIHEVGHMLDSRVLGPVSSSTGFASTRRGELLTHWKDAVLDSRAVREIRNLEGAAGVSEEHRKYLLQDHELWARSYAQWVTTRSRDPELLAVLRQRQGSAYSSQWDDDDFSAIADAIDRIMEAQGWIR